MPRLTNAEIDEVFCGYKPTRLHAVCAQARESNALREVLEMHRPNCNFCNAPADYRLQDLGWDPTKRYICKEHHEEKAAGELGLRADPELAYLIGLLKETQ